MFPPSTVVPGDVTERMAVRVLRDRLSSMIDFAVHSERGHADGSLPLDAVNAINTGFQ